MKALFEIDEWKIIENNFDSDKQEAAESILASETERLVKEQILRKDIVEEVCKEVILEVFIILTRQSRMVENGYPEYFAKVLNSCNWIGIDVEVNDQQLDLANCQVDSFYRELDMFRGTLSRKFVCSFKDGKQIEVESIRFCSMDDDEIGAISYSVTPINFSGQIKFTPYLDFNVRNTDSNHNEMFWNEGTKKVADNQGIICANTKITNFQAAVAMRYSFVKNGCEIDIKPNKIEKDFMLVIALKSI